MIGVLSLMWAPVPEGLLAKDQAFAGLSPLVQKGLLLINPSIMVAAAAFTGAAVAHRVGLRSVLAGTTSGAGFARTAARAGACGVLLGLFLVIADKMSAPLLGPAWQALAETTVRSPAHTAIGVLYGGMTEEVMLRWGFMSLIAWALTLLPGARLRVSCVSLAIIVAALFFAAGHLPTLALQVELSVAIIVRTLVLNTLVGLVFGWLFWRHNLEIAMVAHAASHVGIAVWIALLH